MSKYHARKTTVEGIVFDSLTEAARYRELRLLMQSGEIIELKVHPKYPIEVNGQKICSYIADFTYRDRDGRELVEDVKSPVTRKLPAYRLKKKLNMHHGKLQAKKRRCLEHWKKWRI